MKKIVLNISDTTYEKLRFEAMEQKKDVATICAERLLKEPFSSSVDTAYSSYVDSEIQKILRESI
jgi:hypothetical protein